MRKIHYLKYFQTWYNFWAFFFALLGFLFVLYRVEFPSDAAKGVFYFVFWASLGVAVITGFVVAGLLKLIGVKKGETENRKLLNEEVRQDFTVFNSISNKKFIRYPSLPGKGISPTIPYHHHFSF